MSMSEAISDTIIDPGICTDYSMLGIAIEHPTEQKRGMGFWKFNASLLQDKKYEALVKQCIIETSKENESVENKGLV